MICKRSDFLYQLEGKNVPQENGKINNNELNSILIVIQRWITELAMAVVFHNQQISISIVIQI